MRANLHNAIRLLVESLVVFHVQNGIANGAFETILVPYLSVIKFEKMRIKLQKERTGS
jgi:hypothetical protein